MIDWMRVVDPGLEMRRLAGKVAMLLAGVYGLVVVAVLSDLARGSLHTLWFWLFLTVPGCAFVPAFVTGLRLHLTTDAAVVRRLWRESLLYAVIGVALLIAAAVIVDRMAD